MKIPSMPAEADAAIRQLIREGRMREAAEEYRRFEPCSIDAARKVVALIAWRMGDELKPLPAFKVQPDRFAEFARRKWLERQHSMGRDPPAN